MRVGDIADYSIADYFGAKWVALVAIGYTVLCGSVLVVYGFIHATVHKCRLADGVAV
jgi:hypothetical protein